MWPTLRSSSRFNQHDILSFLRSRNLIEKIYPEKKLLEDTLFQQLKSKPTTIYAGFDVTSDSLHVGNLVTIINLLHFRRLGHRVICVIGDATTQIGDPSGHLFDRLKLDKDHVENNISSFEETLSRLFDNFDKYICPNDMQKPVILRNSSWYKGLETIDFVSDTFRHFRVGSILHKKTISDRLDSPGGMNLAEFCYQVFQSYDWLMLMKMYDCNLQVGGSDQAGNIYSGHEFIKKNLGRNDCFGLLTPIVTDANGKKLGKSSSNINHHIWLKKEKTSPYDLHQFFVKTPDKLTEMFLKMFTFLEDDSIRDLVGQNLGRSGRHWVCQRELAKQVCLLTHGLSQTNATLELVNQNLRLRDSGPVS